MGLSAKEKIISLRHDLDLTQPEFAELLGVSVRTVIYWELPGKKVPKPIEKLIDYMREEQEAKIDAS